MVNNNLTNKGKFVLGTFSPGQGDSYTIELSLPIDADNEYSKLFAKVMWKFSYENADHQDEDDGDDHESNINPNTSDINLDLSIIIFIFSTMGLIITLIFGKINNKEERI